MGSSTSDSEEERKQRKHKKKEKKSKKSKKDKKHKKEKKHKRHRRHRSSSSGTGSESDEWVEALAASEESRGANRGKDAEPSKQSPPVKLEREDWMNSMLIPTYSREPKKEDKKNSMPADQYDPKTSVRELNPYWRNGGTGLPSFRKPVNEDDEDENDYYRQRSSEPQQSNRPGNAGWKKFAKGQSAAPPSPREEKIKQEKVPEVVRKPPDNLDEEFLTDEQLNELGAKIIKAELLGNTGQAESLKQKLEKAKAYRSEMQANKKPNPSRHDPVAHKRRKSTEEEVMYVTGKQNNDRSSQRYDAKKQKRYQQNLPPGPDLSDKFRSERLENDNMDAQFFKVSSKMGDGKQLENIFDHQKASSSASSGMDAIEERTVKDMNRMAKVQADCDRCLNSSKFGHEQLISMGKNVYLAIPTWRALQPKHCFIVPVGHYPCLTQVDEDVHRDIVDVCKALIQMFQKHGMEVIFFETVRYLNRNPHMYIQCVPAKDYEMAPFYFKKAILESETEWAMNKKLHNVDGFNVRRTVPKGLPYFWVNFNMENGFAHVIEDQEAFPVTFATETIAGILGLDTRDWRKPRKEMNPGQKVEEFKRWWRDYDAILQTK